MRSILLKYGWLGPLLALLLLAGCATNPVTGKKQISFMSSDQEEALGAQSDVGIVQQYGVLLFGGAFLLAAIFIVII